MRFVLPLIALATAAAPALALPADQVVTLRVPYHDIDLASAEGRAALEARIDARLRQACRIEGWVRYAGGRSAVDEKCVAEARRVALAEVERIAAAEARRGRQVAAN
jgi:UrcA family protein